jgi:hypothetical protein
MSIKALAILFTASAAAASPVQAQTAEQNAPPLPQFMSAAVRDELAQGGRETNSVSHDTRQAAEALSAKFAGGLPNPDSEAPASKPKSASPVSVEARDDPSGQARVAVLVSPASSAPADFKEAKHDKKTPKLPIAAPAAAAPIKRARVPREHAQERPGRRRSEYPPSQNFASNAVPGAEAGWQTGFIGLLTNPAFWH